VNIDKAEDVLIHHKVLAEAKDPDRRPAFAVRFLRVTFFSFFLSFFLRYVSYGLDFVYTQQLVKGFVKFWVL
jgi:hypothetical protein